MGRGWGPPPTSRPAPAASVAESSAGRNLGFDGTGLIGVTGPGLAPTLGHFGGRSAFGGLGLLGLPLRRSLGCARVYFRLRKNSLRALHGPVPQGTGRFHPRAWDSPARPMNATSTRVRSAETGRRRPELIKYVKSRYVNICSPLKRRMTW